MFHIIEPDEQMWPRTGIFVELGRDCFGVHLVLRGFGRWMRIAVRRHIGFEFCRGAGDGG